MTTPSTTPFFSKRLRRFAGGIGLLCFFFFFNACTATIPSRRMIDGDFARGRLPVSKIELLPMSLAVNIDGLTASDPSIAHTRHKQIALMVEKTLRARLGSKGYRLYRGPMSRNRLFHLISAAERAVISRRSPNQSVGVNPVLLAGGIPGTEAALVIEGLANITTGGKKAAQVTVAVLIAVIVVLVIVAAIAASKSKSKSRSSRSRSRGSRRSGRTYARVGRTRGYRSYRRSGRRYRSYRGYRRSRIRAINRRRGVFRGSYRRYGRRYRYRVVRIRPVIRPAAFIYYTPHYDSMNSVPSNVRPPHHKQPFFSGSYLDLSVTLLEKGTGIVLWHDMRRWKIDPTAPQSIADVGNKLFETMPGASSAPPPANQPAPTQPSQPASDQP